METLELDAFLQALTTRRRVLLLGGLAVIAHGLSRATKDADVWMEPLASTIEWAAAVAEVAGRFPKTWLARLPHWSRVDSLEAIATAARETGIIRVFGLECPLDIFRRPNELDEADFDAVWSRSTPIRHGVHLPEPLDILHSKLETGRPGDLADLAFLEAKIHSNFGQRLKTASVTEAREISTATSITSSPSRRWGIRIQPCSPSRKACCANSPEQATPFPAIFCCA